MRRVLKWIALVAAGLAVVLIVVAAGLFAWLTGSTPQIAGDIRAPGLARPAEILRDSNGIAHIRGLTRDAAYYALGFAHAQDRLWQMDLYRRLGEGRLAEVAGRLALPADRAVRTLGIYRLAETQYESLGQGAKRALDAYTAGVNGYLESHSGPWPPEFTLLMYRPEPWRGADSLVLGKLLALMLGGNWFSELQRAALLEHLTPEQVEVLLPTTADGPPIRYAGLPAPLSAARMAAAVPDFLRPRRASNVWAISGANTESGKPILANDPHLGLTAPGIWYLARIEAPGLSVTGATLPGMPFHLMGHNGTIAWGLTTTYGDLADLFVERLTEGDADSYETPDGPKAFTVREELIRVRFGRDERLRVRETRHGPVISDVFDSAAARAGAGHVVALAAVALLPGDRTVNAIFRLQTAQSKSAFLRALEDFHSPQQNVIYADTEGHIGLVAPARVPIRGARRGLVPSDGAAGDADWTGFVPFEGLPQEFDPAGGVVLNANNSIVGPDYPYFISAQWEPSYRARRIAELLIGGGQTSETSAAMQADSVSVMARDLVPVMAAALRDGERVSPRLAAATRRLEIWDFRMERTAPEPLIFAAWLRALVKRLVADDLDGSFESYWDLHPRTVTLILSERQEWCDDITTAEAESCSEQTQAALADALAELSDDFGANFTRWRWGEAHEVRFLHPLWSFVPGLGQALGLVARSDGGPFTLMRGGIRFGSGSRPFANNHGAGYRAVYDLSNLDNSLYAMAPGQSGNPFSRLFAAQVEGWLEGETFRIPSRREDVITDALGVVRLVPGEE